MEVTRPLLLRLFYYVKWPITPNKSAGSIVYSVYSGTFGFFLAGLRKKSSVLYMLLCPNGP